MIDWDIRFSELARQGQIIEANEVLMAELGRILVTKQSDFVEMLNEAGIDADTDMPDEELVDLYIDNIDTNNDLMLGSSVLVNHWNQKSGYDGEGELSDDGVKKGYGVLRAYYTDPYQDEEYSNVIPLLGMIGKGVKNLWQNRDRIKQGIQAYKGGGPGGGVGGPQGRGMSEDMRKTEAQEAMLSSIIVQKEQEMKAKQEQIDQQNKTTRTALYIAGGVGVVALIITVVLLSKRGKK